MLFVEFSLLFAISGLLLFVMGMLIDFAFVVDFKLIVVDLCLLYLLFVSLVGLFGLICFETCELLLSVSLGC